MTDELQQTIPGERVQTDPGRSMQVASIVKRSALAMAIATFLAFGLWSMRSGTKEPNDDRSERVVIRQTTDFEPAREEPEKVQPLPEVKLPTPELAGTTENAATDEMLEAARRSPVMAFGGGQSSEQRSVDHSQDDTSPYVQASGSFGGERDQENEDERFGRLLIPTQLQGSRAGHLGNRNYIVAMGTSIPCVLETALSSDQPGFTSCVVARDVLSDNGRVVLLDKGTQIVGEYRGGLRRGQKRLFVLWNRAKTPTGVIVALASPATDALGRAGFDGYVETHWWERFGSALLLSIVGDLTGYVGRQLQEQEAGVQATTGVGGDAAAIAVEQSINIPPTLTMYQGAQVSIFVARDLDFSAVYGLRVTEPHHTILDRTVSKDFSRHETLVAK